MQSSNTGERYMKEIGFGVDGEGEDAGVVRRGAKMRREGREKKDSDQRNGK